MADNNEITSETVVTTRRLADVVEGVWGKVRTVTNSKAPLESPAFTGVPTMAQSPSVDDDSTKIATTAFVKNKIDSVLDVADAMQFKGIVNSNSDLPTEDYKAGWTYKVNTAGTYVGNECEAGDLIICLTDFDTTPHDTDWGVVQGNIDGAVVGPNSVGADGNIALFNGTSGKAILDSTRQISDVYDSSSSNIPSHKTIRDAIKELDVNDITGLGADKTITALSETDGKIEATASSIQIAESQVTNLTTDLSGKANKVSGAVTGNFASLDANGNLADSGSKASDFKTKQTAVTDPTADGNALAFIDSIAQNENGEIVVTKKNVNKVKIIPNPDTDNTILTGESDGTYDWQPMEKSAWGTIVTDGENNLVDENGNAIMDENEVDLWTTFKGVGFGAERAAADVEGNPIVDTYAKKSEITTALDGKVDKVAGKGLSTEDYTTTDKSKLAGIAESAQVNVIESVSLNGTAITPDANKNVNIVITEITQPEIEAIVNQCT